MNTSSLVSPRILAVIGIAFAASSVALANGASGTIYLETGLNYNQADPYQYGNGGEFDALLTNFDATAFPVANVNIPLYSNTPGGYNVPTGYSNTSSANTTFTFSGTSASGATNVPVEGFQTFCIEDGVDFSVGTTYNYVVGNTLQQTGTGVITTLTAGAAYLYQQFALGTLKGFNYTNAAQEAIDAGILQATLWALQGEPADSSVPFISVAGYASNSSVYSSNQNFALADLDAYFGNPTGSNIFAANAQLGVATDNIFGVSVLELYSGSNSNANFAQDQLVYWGPGESVPDNGTTALLIGASFLVLAIGARHMKLARSK